MVQLTMGWTSLQLMAKARANLIWLILQLRLPSQVTLGFVKLVELTRKSVSSCFLISPHTQLLLSVTVLDVCLPKEE